MDGSESTFVAHGHLGALLFVTFKKETKQVQSRKTPMMQEDTHSAQMEGWLRMRQEQTLALK